MLDTTYFSESEDISTWAVDAVKNVSQAGIIIEKVNSLYEPQSISTRSEAAAVFVGLIEAINR